MELAPSRDDALCLFESRGDIWLSKRGAAIRLLALTFFHSGRIRIDGLETRRSTLSLGQELFCRAFEFDTATTRRAGQESTLSPKAHAAFRRAARECSREGAFEGDGLPWPPEPEDAELQ